MYINLIYVALYKQNQFYNYIIIEQYLMSILIYI